MSPSSQNSSGNELAEPLLGGISSVSDDAAPILVDGLPWETSYLIKSLYFVEALGSATWGRFGTIYYNLHHLTSRQIGLLEGFMTIVPTLCLPIWGIVADQCNSRKAVYVITKAVSTILLLTLSLPYVYHSYARIVAMSLLTKVRLRRDSSFYSLCDECFLTEFYLDCVVRIFLTLRCLWPMECWIRIHWNC